MPRPRQPLSSTERAEVLWSQGAALMGLHMLLSALLHQGSEPNNLGSQNGQGPWEKTLFHPAPKTVHSLRTAHRDIPLFVILSKLWFPVSV